MKIPILYEDDSCFIVNKPNNVLVHHSYYARNIEELSLVERLRQQGFISAVPVHRLDRKTSGLVLFVKEKEYAQAFQLLFETQTIRKVYYALLRGHVSESGVIDSPVKNERGNYKEALTEFQCLEQFDRPFAIPPYPVQRYSLVAFIPKTGRMHQLRIHANKMAHPIINDPKYGNRHHNHYFQEVLGIQELFLHAQSLQFIHPFTGVAIEINAPLPEFWSRFTGVKSVELPLNQQNAL